MTLAIPAAFASVSFVVMVAAASFERRIAWHRTHHDGSGFETMPPLIHRGRRSGKSGDVLLDWVRPYRRVRYDPRYNEFDPRLDRPLSIARQMAGIVLAVSLAAMLAIWLFGAT